MFIDKVCNININSLDTLEEKWKRFKENVTEICTTVLGLKRKQQDADWITSETWELIEERKIVKGKMLSENAEDKLELFREKHKQLSKDIKKHVKKDKKSYYGKMRNEAQTAANKGNSKELYKIIRKLSGKDTLIRNTPVEDETGSLVTSKDEQTKVWKRHFENTLNISQNHQAQFLISKIHPTNAEVKTENPSIAEIEEAINTLKPGKAPGNDDMGGGNYPTRLERINYSETS
ncbi:uncharacterized protein [Musca autumnalis]|uniref:uncharacterized protein n=1 Tax=Musca autumnalis TaxID=221902 RepID=UPI003CE944B3